MRSPQEKGRVESGVGYVKGNFLRGLEIADFKVIPTLAQKWLDEIANERIHGETGKRPMIMWQQEKPQLGALSLNPYDVSSSHRLRASSTFSNTIAALFTTW